MNNVTEKGGFIKEYFAQLKETTSTRAAYEATEAIYNAKHSKNRYSSFESFKVVKNRYLQQK